MLELPVEGDKIRTLDGSRYRTVAAVLGQEPLMIRFTDDSMLTVKRFQMFYTKQDAIRAPLSFPKGD